MPRSFLIKKTSRQHSSSSSSSSSSAVVKTLKPSSDLHEAVVRYTGTIGLGTSYVNDVTSYANDHALSLSLQSDYESRLFTLSHYGDNGMREETSSCSSSSSCHGDSVNPPDDEPLALDTHRRNISIPIPSSGSSKVGVGAASITSVPSPVSASSPPPLLIPAKRSRASGFQSGITVGYTYEAFFVTDGRSRRRNKMTSSALANSNNNFNNNSNSNGVMLTRSPVTSPLPPSISATLAPPSDNNNNSVGDKDQHPKMLLQTQQVSPNGRGSLSPASASSPASAAAAAAETAGSNSSSRPRYNCADCGKSYATSSNLSRHKQTHRNMESQQAKACPHCSKTYVSMPALSMHILTHDLRHTCSVCGKAFSRPWLLQGHMRSHTGEKPYGCAHCGKAFADRSNLRAHMQTHSPLKHFRCKRCHKTFALKSYLNKHSESACVMRRGANGEQLSRDCGDVMTGMGEEEEGEVTSFDDVEVDEDDDSCDSTDQHLLEAGDMDYATSASPSSSSTSLASPHLHPLDFTRQLPICGRS